MIRWRWHGCRRWSRRRFHKPHFSPFRWSKWHTQRNRLHCMQRTYYVICNSSIHREDLKRNLLQKKKISTDNLFHLIATSVIVSLKHVFQESNQFVDFLAKWGAWHDQSRTIWQGIRESSKICFLIIQFNAWFSSWGREHREERQHVKISVYRSNCHSSALTERSH